MLEADFILLNEGRRRGQLQYLQNCSARCRRGRSPKEVCCHTHPNITQSFQQAKEMDSPVFELIACGVNDNFTQFNRFF